MPQFKYSGRDYSGSLVSGYVDAGTATDVAEKLFGDRVTPIEIKEASGKPVKKAKGTARSRMDLGPDATAIDKANAFFGFDKIEIDELIMFSRQMHSLTKAGLPLDRAIKGLEASMSNRNFRRILRDVITGLENGNTLATALGQHPKVFSQLFLSLVHVGENTGRLDRAFIEISKYLELEKDTRKQIKSATRYPIFVLVTMAVALGVITVFVIPVFSETFERFGAELPWQTVWLINTSNFAVNYWP
ncbi:MAG: MSHA biogenesis protein MshG, partial [Pseudohongiellaceae bacterium]